MSDWQQVNVRVKEPTYEEWKQVAEEEYGGLSALVRTAVRREIDGAHTGAGGVGSSVESESINEVLQAIDRLENTVEWMDSRLSVVRETVESTGPDYSFRAAVRETVPEEEENWLTAEQIAARLDAKKSDVIDALETLEYEEEVRQIPVGVWEGQDETAWVRMEGV